MAAFEMKLLQKPEKAPLAIFQELLDKYNELRDRYGSQLEIVLSRELRTGVDETDLCDSHVIKVELHGVGSVSVVVAGTIVEIYQHDSLKGWRILLSGPNYLKETIAAIMESLDAQRKVAKRKRKRA
jgi:hypothetical protein